MFSLLSCDALKNCENNTINVIMSTIKNNYREKLKKKVVDNIIKKLSY